MSLRSRLRTVLGPTLRRHPAVWEAVKSMDVGIERARHSAARALPVLVRPEPRQIHV